MNIILKAKDISLGGILTAFTVILLYLTMILSVNKLALLILASFMITIAQVRSNIKTAFAVYISSSILAFFIVPFNMALLYTTPFGLYTLIRYFIEKTPKIYLQILLKFVIFNILLVVSLGLFSLFITLPSLDQFYALLSKFTFLEFLKPVHNNLVIPWLFALVFFIFYDYALTLLMRYYNIYFSE